jgi:hypothetical protein
MADRIRINDELLSRNLQAFVRSPQGRSVLEPFDMTFGECLAITCLLGCMAMCMVPTIVWTLAGLQTLWGIMRLKSFEPMYDNAARQPEKLRPLIGHGIIIGPDQVHSLVLGTFLPATAYSPDWLNQMARWLGEVYAGKASQAGHEQLYELLHDDSYRPDRRRRLPAKYENGLELYLFDVEVKLTESIPTPYETLLFAFVAEPGEKGGIAAVPWFVAKDAVTVS